MQMLETLINSPFFGLLLSILAWCAGRWLQKKTGWMLCNPMLVAVAIIVGVLLLTGRHSHERSSAGWLLAVPCPVCAGAILLSVALGRLLMPESHFIAWIMAGVFFAVNLGCLAVLRFFTGAGRLEAHRLTGRLMIFVGMYFAGLVLLIPHFEQVEKMYRIAAGTSMPEVRSAALPVLLGGAVLLCAGWGYDWLKKRLYIRKRENDRL